jgi:hypothetical protein
VENQREMGELFLSELVERNFNDAYFGMVTVGWLVKAVEGHRNPGRFARTGP